MMIDSSEAITLLAPSPASGPRSAIRILTALDKRNGRSLVEVSLITDDDGEGDGEESVERSGAGGCVGSSDGDGDSDDCNRALLSSYFALESPPLLLDTAFQS